MGAQFEAHDLRFSLTVPNRPLDGAYAPVLRGARVPRRRACPATGTSTGPRGGRGGRHRPDPLRRPPPASSEKMTSADGPRAVGNITLSNTYNVKNNSSRDRARLLRNPDPALTRPGRPPPSAPGLTAARRLPAGGGYRLSRSGRARCGSFGEGFGGPRWSCSVAEIVRDRQSSSPARRGGRWPLVRGRRDPRRARLSSINQFLSPPTNRGTRTAARTRAGTRFALEVVDAVRSCLAQEGLWLLPDRPRRLTDESGRAREGWHGRRHRALFRRELREHGIDLLDTSTG